MIAIKFFAGWVFGCVGGLSILSMWMTLITGENTTTLAAYLLLGTLAHGCFLFGLSLIVESFSDD